MPISYRSEPMINRERRLWQLLREGHVLKRPILKAYIGVPVRIRLIHAAVKETHVFHLHVYEWHAADVPGDAPGESADVEDQGQKGFNYRSEPIGPRFSPTGVKYSLANPHPATPVFRVPAGRQVRFQLLGALDKPRSHSFTIHGVTWPEWRFLASCGTPRVSSASAITCGTVKTSEFTPRRAGDYAYRSGAERWDVAQGMWGLLRVVPC
ncbi:hypothetical protein D7Y13_35865 [Corallococcus praedator]|uniref:Plastocyanin-like domain-containing protein n=1 Tax=Corallococcus praedator TaxID=2316724 RepID=A0ABX9Q7K7_9BACT|nr:MULTISPECIES: hypothetical protein [Corallococcus]RKH34573.1 hypothetical protein D7X75_07705 [Corallococcus sp. CA031C]RKH92650.1 hypothetical protein D7Y13_35865 [Corallococcus praedator]